MRHSTQTLVVAFVATVMMGLPCLAQDVELPLAWEGEGEGVFIGQYGTEEMEFEFEMSVDEQGIVDGQTSSDDWTSKIKHLFYSEKKEYDFPGFFSRNLVIVFMINEDGGSPMLTVLNGRLLGDNFLYGEVVLRWRDELISHMRPFPV